VGLETGLGMTERRSWASRVVAAAAAALLVACATPPDESSGQGTAASTDPQASAAASPTRQGAAKPVPAAPATVVPVSSELDWQGPSTASWDLLLAASEDTVWVASDDRWYRGESGSWQRVGPRGPFQAAVLASDGALWARTGESLSGSGDLVRIEADAATVVARGVQAGRLYAGDEGQVWLGETPEDRVVGYRPDGSIHSVDPPEGMDGVCLRSAGSDGSLHVTEVLENEEGDLADCDAAVTWARWDGQRWEAVDLPLSFDASSEERAPRFIDNVAWSSRGAVLRRYADGSESAFVVSSALVPFWSAAPSGSMCGFEFGDEHAYDNAEEPKFIVCFDETGESARFDVEGLGLTGFSVAPEGSVWVKGASWASPGAAADPWQAPQKAALLPVPVP
jgi:hypothetical protein